MKCKIWNFNFLFVCASLLWTHHIDLFYFIYIYICWLMFLFLQEEIKIMIKNNETL
jgi:hypothetical protein